MKIIKDEIVNAKPTSIMQDICEALGHNFVWITCDIGEEYRYSHYTIIEKYVGNCIDCDLEVKREVHYGQQYQSSGRLQKTH